MRVARIALILSFVFLVSVRLGSQQTTAVAQRDPQAVSVLTQALTAAGGSTSLGSIKDFTGTGTITYSWAGQQVQGTATVKGIGTAQVRLDANLLAGIRSWTAGFGQGSIRNLDGTLTPIASHNTLNLGALTIPQLKLAAPLNDSTFSVRYEGLTSIAGRPAHDIQIQQSLSTSEDPNGILSHLTAMDFLIDASTYQILLVRDTTHPTTSATQDLVHEVEFSDYHMSGSCVVPFLITERINGQRTWTIQLSAIAFNTGLTDADFQL